MNILIVAGHPADMFDHCGGTMLHHIKAGDHVTCCTITQGLRIHDEVIYDMFRADKFKNYSEEEIDKILEERREVKYREVKEACALFGMTDIRFLEFDDEILRVTPSMVSKLAMLIREVQPDLVITHWPYQENSFANHHAVTGQLTLAAIAAAHGINFEQGTPSWNVAQVAYMICPADYECQCATQLGKTAYPNFFVNIEDVIDLKVKAVNCMKSQKYNTPGYPQKTVEYWCGNIGSGMRLSYAEGFVIEYPEIGNTIPVSDHRKWMAHGDEREILAAISHLDAVNVKLDD